MALNDQGGGTPAEALRQSLADLVAESKNLRGDVAKDAAERRRANRLNLAFLAVITGFVLGSVILVWQNNHLSHQVNDLTQQMADCTTPGGNCYTKANERTGSAIADIVRAEIYMAQCARLFPGESGPSYDTKLEACVYERLADPARKRSPAPSPSPTGRG